MTQADLTSFEAVGDKLFLKEGTKIENLITESTSDRDESKAALFDLVVDELLLPPPEASAEELHGKSKTPPKMCIFFVWGNVCTFCTLKYKKTHHATHFYISIFPFLGFCELESSRPRSTSPNLPELEVATITNLVAGEGASPSAIQVRIKNNG